MEVLVERLGSSGGESDVGDVVQGRGIRGRLDIFSFFEQCK